MPINSLEGVQPGDLYLAHGHVYRVESLCWQPTIKLIELENGRTVEGAIGCLNLQPFVRLLCEDDGQRATVTQPGVANGIVAGD